MKKGSWILFWFLGTTSQILLGTSVNQDALDLSQGWSLNLGGQVGGHSLSTPPTYQGPSYGLHANIAYQQTDAFGGELRAVYQDSRLANRSRKLQGNESYLEWLAGYDFFIGPQMSLLPHVGMGVDCLKVKQHAYDSIRAIELTYQTSYALLGLKGEYRWKKSYLGAQVDGLFIFSQYLSIDGLPGSAWSLKRRLGMDLRLPIGYQLSEKCWLEMAPYYRLLPLGASHELGLPQRDLRQYGVFLTFRFFL